MEQKYIRICRNTLYATLKILHSSHIMPLIWAVNTAYKYPWSISLNSCTCPSTSFSDTPFLLRSIWLLLCSPNWKNNALQHSPGCTPKSTVQPSSLSFLNSLLSEIQQAIVLQTQKKKSCVSIMKMNLVKYYVLLHQFLMTFLKSLREAGTWKNSFRSKILKLNTICLRNFCPVIGRLGDYYLWCVNWKSITCLMKSFNNMLVV